MSESALIGKVWNYASILRDSGVSYTDYVSQITYLLFLKMDDEREKFLGVASLLPSHCKWQNLSNLDGVRSVLSKLAIASAILSNVMPSLYIFLNSLYSKFSNHFP